MPHSNPASSMSVPSVVRTSGARFFLEGVDAPVRAHVASRDDAGVTLRQELPFLQLARKMRDEEGRVATLASVGVALRDGTPSLVLDFRYDGRGDEPTVSFSSADEPSPQAAPEARCGRVERRDSTMPYALERHHGPLPYAPQQLDEEAFLMAPSPDGADAGPRAPSAQRAHAGRAPDMGTAPATPPSLPVPTATRAWHRILWDGLRAAYAAL